MMTRIWKKWKWKKWKSKELTKETKIKIYETML